MAEGIIFKGFLLTHDEFVKIYKEDRAQDIRAGLKTEIDNLLLKFDKMTANMIFAEWSRIQKEYFFPVTILGVSVPNPSGGGDVKYQFSANIAEEQTLGGNQIAFKKIMQYEMAKDLQDTLSRHYIGMVSAINSNTFSKKEAQEFHIYLSYQVQRILGYKTAAKTSKQKARFERAVASATKRSEEHFTGKPYSNIYGEMPGYSREGKQLDAYMNHMGAHHPDIFNADKTIQVEMAHTILALHQTVAQEEGKHFFQLLKDSLNTTPWYAGGDIVVIDADGAVLYNIQLKSSQRNAAYFKIRTQALRKSLLEIQETYAADNLEKAANAIYNTLKIDVANDIGPREEDYVDKILEKISPQLTL